MNIVLLISDTFRFDNLFSRGAIPVRTPHLDAFAERAVSASRMITSSFPTIPHRTDLTTGRYGWPWRGWQDCRRSGENHLPTLLKPEGFVSQLICDCPHLFRNGFDAGFDGSLVLRGQEGDIDFTRMNKPFEHAMPPGKTRYSQHFKGRNLVDISRWNHGVWRHEAETFPPRTAAKVIEWIEANHRHDPLLLWADFFDPHEPWDPPEYFVRRYDPSYTGTPMTHPNYGRASDYTDEELRNLRAHYCAEAELVDRWVGRVMEKIDDLGLWDNSIVVFTTDHGISLGEHNRTGKSNINTRDDRFWPLYPEIAHVPFMIAAPGLTGGTTLERFVQPPDILPTLLELAGLDGVETPEPIHGRSFAPLLRGEEPAEPWREFAVAGCLLRKARCEYGSGATTPVVYTDRWVYAPIGSGGQRELYDWSSDPLAEKNRIDGNESTADRLHGLLIEWLESVGAPREAIEPYKT